MSTVLTRLSAQLDDTLAPVLAALDEAAASLLELRVATPDVEALAPRLAAHREGIRTLREKVAAQHSYALLFGPLKSGKSTLMNALSAAYVSEVTSLPAYPCMVYVRHAPSLEVSLARWDGTVERFSGLVPMRAHLAAAHAELAHALRAAEAAVEDFDPGVHHSRAIRRVDVEMPAPELLQSGTVLVDTPGLYTRMKFGYDQLTREFRMASAVAIFVVKTDNLFLEQVFAEFEDLLRIFSKIFLVVNLDTAKRDLEPSGGLEPSLEQRDPARILTAFEELAMGTMLRRARDEGRLKVYPIDLLQAASARIRAHSGKADGAEVVVPDEFARFFADLTEYLNSHEALLAFVRDSLRQGGDLVGQLGRVCRGEGTALAARLVVQAEVERSRAAEKLAAAGRLRVRSFDEGLASFRDDVAGITRERSADVRKRAADRAEQVLDHWFETDRSFSQLVGEDLVEVFSACRDALAELATDAARTVLGSDVAAAAIRRLAPEDLRTLDLPLADLSRSALAELGAVGSEKSATISIPSSLIPVKRRLVDWLMLRGPVRLRRALFGREDAPTRPISRAVKQKRLGAAARGALGAAVRVRLDRFFAESLAQSSVAAFGSGASIVGAGLRYGIERAGIDASTALDEARATLARYSALRAGFEMAAGSAERAGAALAALAVEHGVADVADAPAAGATGIGARPDAQAGADASVIGDDELPADEDWLERP